MNERSEDALDAALAVLRDPEQRYFDPAGEAALEAVRAHVEARGGDAALVARLKDVIDFGHRSFRIPCYRLLGSPAALPGGDAILVDEVENPLRSDEELWAAAQWLGRGQRDLDLVRRWIESGSERQLRGGLTLLRNIDPRRLPDGAIDEAKRLVALAAERPRLPAHAADDVIGFVEGFRDRALAPSLLGLVQHPDPEVRDRSRAVLAKLRG